MQSETLITEDSDLALVHASKGGDRAAFEELVKRYDQRLFRIAQNIVHNREDAEEAVQESFLKAFQQLAHFQERSQFSTWLIRIAVNESFMKLRKQHARSALSTISIDDEIQTEDGALPREIVDWTAGPEELYRTSELREILIKALQALRPSLRVVFVLRDIEELSVSETADALGLTSSAVKARLLRARLQLRERLNKYLRTPAGHAHTALRDPIHTVKTAAL
jgi:RNA polymerase sigma-70 factor (ECF subfamily)